MTIGLPASTKMAAGVFILWISLTLVRSFLCSRKSADFRLLKKLVISGLLLCASGPPSSQNVWRGHRPRGHQLGSQRRRARWADRSQRHGQVDAAALPCGDEQPDRGPIVLSPSGARGRLPAAGVRRTRPPQPQRDGGDGGDAPAARVGPDGLGLGDDRSRRACPRVERRPEDPPWPGHAAARRARPAAARRADQPPGRRRPRVARRLPQPLPRRGADRLARPRLSGRDRRSHPVPRSRERAHCAAIPAATSSSPTPGRTSATSRSRPGGASRSTSAASVGHRSH